jgi:hypothetical protein
MFSTRILAASALLLTTATAQPANCRNLLATYGLTFNASLQLPAELASLNPGLQNGQVDFSGTFSAKRCNMDVTGRTTNAVYPSSCASALITSAMLFQTSVLTTPINGYTTSMSYCPINITFVPLSILTSGGAMATRWDIWWVVDSLPCSDIKRVQCMSLARLPDANGKNVMMSFQGSDGFSCPSNPIVGQASISPAEYTRTPGTAVPNTCAGSGSASSDGRGPSVALGAALAALLGAAFMLAA